MYLHRSTYAFFITSLCIINSFNNHIVSADHIVSANNPLLYSDTNQHIFKHGTAGTRRTLCCTCKILEESGARYHQEKAHEFNNTFQGIEFIMLPKIDKNDYFLIPSAILMPGSE